MKTKVLLLCTILLSVTTISNAEVWRVSNRVINGITVNADFSTLQDAINGASAGDTLYLMGSQNSYGNGTFDKPLVVIGPGYWLSVNNQTQAVSDSAQVGTIIFNTGSAGSEIQGLYIYGQYTAQSQSWNLVSVNTDSITIKKNHIYGYAANYRTGTGKVINIVGDRKNIVIQQNWIEALINDWGSSYDGNVHCVYFSGIPTECLVQNNLLRAWRINSYGGYYAIRMEIEDVANDLKIYNNVIWGNYTTYYTEQLNNIFVSGARGGGGDLMMHNLCDGTQYPINPPGLNNQQNVDMSTVFVDFEKYIDNGYELAPGSPAIGTGVNGGDCGVFSFDTGGYPYVLSGMPAIPAIYEATVEPMGENSVPVTIKAKSHNEHK